VVYYVYLRDYNTGRLAQAEEGEVAISLKVLIR
jgi:hypothetical protein